MIRFVLLAILTELAALAAFPLVPIAVAFSDSLGRLPFRRTSPTLVAMAAALSLTDAQLDQLFITAAGIEA